MKREIDGVIRVLTVLILILIGGISVVNCNIESTELNELVNTFQKKTKVSIFLSAIVNNDLQSGISEKTGNRIIDNRLNIQ